MSLSHAAMKILVIFIFFWGMVKADDIPANILIHKGLVLLPINTIAFATEKYELKYKLNISAFFENSVLLINCSTALEKICERLRDDAKCEQFVKYVKFNIKRVNNDVQNIISFNVDSHGKRNARNAAIRIKRSSDVACGFCDWLYGGDRRIQQLRNTTIENRRLVKQTASILNDTMNLQQVEFAQFETKLNILSGEIIKLNEKMDFINVTGEIDEYMQLIHTLTFEHGKLYGYLMNILDENSRMNILNIIRYEKLKDDLKRVFNDIPRGKNFPINIDNENLYHLMRVCEVSSELIDRRLKLSVKIPLIETTEFVNYKVFPIPMLKNEIAYKYSLDDRFITFNKNLSNFIEFNGKTMNCVNIISGRAICGNKIPRNSSFSCIKDILLDNSEKECPMIRSSQTNEIISLGSTHYYFFVRSPMKIVFTCYKNLTAEFTIIQSRIRSFDPNCVFRTEKFIFETNRESTGETEWIDAFEFGNISLFGFDKIIN